MATQTYCDWQAVSLRVMGSLHDEGESPLPTDYNTIISRSTQDAAAELKRVFILKGYTPSQIASSDDVRNWNERLATFYSLSALAGLGRYNMENIDKSLDCREDFMNASALVINDVAVAPSLNGSPVGGVDNGQVGAAQQAACDFDRMRGFGGGWFGGYGGGWR